MNKKNNFMTNSDLRGGQMLTRVNRRYFLRSAGVATTLGVFVLGACKDHDIVPGIDGATVDLGEGDVGILNYAYALEQLEAAFYTEAVAKPYAGMTDMEMRMLTDIRDHEIIHRDFFQAALTPTGMIIPGLALDFSSVDFSSRASVLGTAKVLEDTGVAAYNGAGKLITTPDYLVLAGKIVSVEARHAAAIRDLLMPNTTSFAGDDIVDAQVNGMMFGLDRATPPKQILPAVQPFFKTTLTANASVFQ
ncbi:hypothetical protein HNQ92_003311 [Rhabdobacter roseus]|uniref:Ferritin-like domain-containing protein n=1 Tax=Rhabdobacter roseus TaxID=1655419 RepID=A0A840TV72_9BACT|nr:ferritin-like domain-containing protein [Rhabdobacter roseus]MBB5285163.1 hypothetical protein [Rhabdobacter roseus]